MVKILNDDEIELTVPIYQFEDYINGLFVEGEFLAEYQKLEILNFGYNESDGVFTFHLAVRSKGVN